MNNDLLWLAINAYHEARGEDRNGQIAVCHVVLNRCEQTKKSVKDVVLKPFQFSWANGGARPPIKDYASLENCYAAVQECLLQRQHGLSLDGANHYFSDTIPAPSWAAKMTEICKIGHHTFYRG